MRAIRGATTLYSDSPEEVRFAVKELLDEMHQKNHLLPTDDLMILFSNTDDIRSLYPAKAAREAGYATCALFSAAEPDIEGSLPRCVRVLILTETEGKTVPVYLHDAANLRKDITSILNVALDGPAGSGKSTVAKALAKKFDILYLDTGAMYRACALYCVEHQIDMKDVDQVALALPDICLDIRYIDGSQHTILNGVDVSETIRRNDISAMASIVSSVGCIREKMVSMQRDIAQKMSCVIDGRDIGTHVLPNAKYKFFLTASPEVRAQRRFDDNKVRGFDSDFDTILKEIKERDYRDEHRDIAPLRQADDAVVVDTSYMSIDQVVSLMYNTIQKGV